MKNAPAKNIDAYIAEFPAEVQQRLQQIRNLIQQEAPAATEAIKYAMPTFVLNGNLVHFAGYKSHIGFYPAPTGIEAYQKDLAGYKTGKGSIQFPLDEPLPLPLITKIIKWRVKENSRKSKKV